MPAFSIPSSRAKRGVQRFREPTRDQHRAAPVDAGPGQALADETVFRAILPGLPRTLVVSRGCLGEALEGAETEETKRAEAHCLARPVHAEK